MPKVDHVAELKAMAAAAARGTYELNVGGEIYKVRRSDFIMISGPDGRAILVRTATIPDAFIPDLIMAYRAGRKSGRYEARREIRDAMEDE